MLSSKHKYLETVDTGRKTDRGKAKEKSRKLYKKM
jgi:hypothetical protein